MKIIARQDIETSDVVVAKGKEADVTAAQAAALIAHGYAVAADAQAEGKPETAAKKPAAGGKATPAKAAPALTPTA